LFVRQGLGTNADIKKAEVNTPKNKKNAPAAESDGKRRKRTKDKLIRLNDLIPEKDVKGGHQVLFGVSDTTQTNNPKNK
jgi:hypothetical protein